MENNFGIRAHDECAAEYDEQIRKYKAFANDAVFGLSFEYVNPHESLLDIGIGTGLGSLPFAKAGLEVFGIDGSAEMLKICRSKDFAKDLKLFDLQNMPLPYSNDFFDHAISCGVFHFLGDLGPILKEVSRIIKPGGIFAFTILAQASFTKGKRTNINQKGYSEMSRDGSTCFMHSCTYIEKLLQNCSFDKLKEFKFLVWSGREDIDDLFYAYVARKPSI